MEKKSIHEEITGGICEGHPNLPFEHNNRFGGPGMPVYDNRCLVITRGHLWWKKEYCAATHTGGSCNRLPFYL